MDKFSDVLKTKYPSFDPTPYKTRFAQQLYGTAQPTDEQKASLDYLKPIHILIWIYSYQESNPVSVDQILHNRAHAEALCEISKDCHLDEDFRLE